MLKRTEIGVAVRARRKELGLTQEEAAALAGCSPRFVYAVEHDKPRLALDKLLDLLEVLGLSVTLTVGRAG